MGEAEKNDNYYAILGVDRGAQPDVIRESYRRLMQQAGNHPDLGGDTRRAALINKAYAVLRNPVSRSEYDSRLDVLEFVARGIALEPEHRPLDLARACLFCEQPHDLGAHELAEASCMTCGSALQAVDTFRLESSDQRSVQRLGRSFDMSIFTHWSQKKGYAAKTEDISPHGLRMVAKCGLYLGQRVRMVSDMLDAVGEITHCTSDRALWHEVTIAGVAFLTLRFRRPDGVFVSRQA